MTDILSGEYILEHVETVGDEGERADRITWYLLSKQRTLTVKYVPTMISIRKKTISMAKRREMRVVRERAMAVCVKWRD